MPEELVSVKEAAKRLGIQPTTLYGWLGASDRGLLILRGSKVTVDYFQGGPKGEGKILLEPGEVERLLNLMRVEPTHRRERKAPVPQGRSFPGITVSLGRPLQ